MRSFGLTLPLITVARPARALSCSHFEVRLVKIYIKFLHSTLYIMSPFTLKSLLQANILSQNRAAAQELVFHKPMSTDIKK